MKKEKKSNHPAKTSGKKTGKRFGKSRDHYVDSFRWGFVAGEEQNDYEADDDLLYDQPRPGSVDDDEKERRESKDKNRSKSPREGKRSTGKKEPRQSAAPAEPSGKNDRPEKSPGNRSKRASKKAVRKTVPTYPLFDEEDDDGDLNLPSYGRTPVPTDDELPKAISKKEGAAKPKPHSKTVAKPTDRPHADRETGSNDPSPPRSDKRKDQAKERNREFGSVKTETAETAKNVPPPPKKEKTLAEKPKKKQMVWDPDKREYVPLVAPDMRDAARKPEPEKRSKKPEPPPRHDTASRHEPKARPDATPADLKNAPSEASAPKTDVKLERSPRKRSKTKPRETPAPIVDEKPKSQDRPDPAAPAPPANRERPAEKSEKKGPKERRPHQRRGNVAPMMETNRPDPADIESETKGFAELGVSDAMLEALKIVRYLEPTPIQSGVFKQLRAGRDVMGQAQTGTGKTAAFSIPIIEGVEECPPGNDPVALILVPTRELAVQVRDEAARLAYGRDIRVAACYGGKPIAKQIARLKDGVDIIVGTPGRILDLMNRRALSLDSLRWVVLDEADRMLDIGFRPDIEKILRRTPTERQTLLFSATLPPPVVKLAEKYMRSPEVLDFSNKGVAVETIEQFYVTVDPERKFEALVYLLNEQQPNQAIIFTRTKRGADRLARLLSKRVDSLAAIHGDLSQGERDRVMGQFRSGKLRYLVATDVVGRGIDVSGISHIINYDIPQFCDDYVHRVGRTGRMGREGVAYTFVTVQEGSELTRIEMRIDKLLKRADLKGFESFTKPVESDDEPDGESSASKPVFGKSVRKIRRAL